MQELQQYLALGRNVSAALYGAAKKALGYKDLPTEMAVEGKDRSLDLRKVRRIESGMRDAPAAYLAAFRCFAAARAFGALASWESFPLECQVLISARPPRT